MKRMLLAALCAVAIIGCEKDTTEPDDTQASATVAGLRLTALALIQTGQVTLHIAANNPADSAVSVRLPGSCMLRARLYGSNGSLAWDGITQDPECGEELQTYNLAARQTLPTVWQYTFTRTMLGTAFPSGTYRVVAALRPSGRFGNVVEIAAGSVTIN